MIIVTFIYKGASIATREIKLSYTKENCNEVRYMLRKKLIKYPENWDKYELHSGVNDV